MCIIETHTIILLSTENNWTIVGDNKGDKEMSNQGEVCYQTRKGSAMQLHW